MLPPPSQEAPARAFVATTAVAPASPGPDPTAEPAGEAPGPDASPAPPMSPPRRERRGSPSAVNFPAAPARSLEAYVLPDSPDLTAASPLLRAGWKIALSEGAKGSAIMLPAAARRGVQRDRHLRGFIALPPATGRFPRRTDACSPTTSSWIRGSRSAGWRVLPRPRERHELDRPSDDHGLRLLADLAARFGLPRHRAHRARTRRGPPAQGRGDDIYTAAMAAYCVLRRPPWYTSNF